MNQTTKSNLDLLNRIATAALWMAIPAGIALGMSIKAFEAVFPAWFFPAGCLLQVALYIALLVLVDKRVPRESVQAKVGSLFMFFLPVPVFLLLEASGNADWEKVQQFSPFVAWAIPIVMMGIMSLPFVEEKSIGQ